MDELQAAQRRYDRIAPIYDPMEGLVEVALYRDWRQMLWSKVEGERILEIGTGTGKNVAFYPDGSEIHAFDISWNMLGRAAGRQPSGTAVHHYQMDAQRLAMEGSTFNTAVATFVFCSVPDPIQGLQEAKRVIKPGGRLLLLEHTRARPQWLGRLMDLLDPITVRLMGPHINRATAENVERAGWTDIQVKELDNWGIFLLIEARKGA